MNVNTVLDMILKIKPTFWMRRERRCKTCVYMSHYCYKIRHRVKPKQLCCEKYSPSKKYKRL